ncbi:flagellar hook-basal body protein [Agilicoccus flavus]|uniref:flagellar hook-basal body protein n=1 Tax=Agilicoccus flavus TaxID=2775968 RepID=UPI001CF6B64B|nr:flagellar hook-basal body complex protein [Agilicoccus flavus]
MFRSFDVAVSGLRQHQTYIDVTGNNIANVNSDGFKASRAMFEDKLSQLARGTGMTPMPQPKGARNAAMVGLGADLRGIEGEFHQGAFKITNTLTDFAIAGEGYFVLQGANGPVYTRNGTFTFDANGTLRAGDGKAVLGVGGQPLTVPQGADRPRSMTMNAAGQLVGMGANGAQRVIGQVQLARFTNEAGLERVGDTEFAATNASGAAILGTSGQNGLGDLISGVTEHSGVDLGAELTHLIMAQRGFSANAKVMTTTDELVDRINQMR